MISIVIAAFNESHGIGPTLNGVRNALASAAIPDFEIIVVDDGSADDTAEQARQAGATVIVNPLNIGYGHSLKRGILSARHDTIVITDADATYPVDRIPALLTEYNKGFDMVVGQRTGREHRGSLVKAPLRWVLKFLVEYAAGCIVPDVNSGLRIFNRQTAQSFFNHLCGTFSFTTSLTLAYLMNGKFVGYVPVPYYKRSGHSKVRLFRDSLRTLQYIIEAVVYFNPLKAFLLVSALTACGAAASFVVGAVSGLNAPYYLGVGGLMIAVVTMCFGFLAVLLKQIMLHGQIRNDRASAGPK